VKILKSAVAIDPFFYYLLNKNIRISCNDYKNDLLYNKTEAKRNIDIFSNTAKAE
jgi:hypothetical protein